MRDNHVEQILPIDVPRRTHGLNADYLVPVVKLLFADIRQRPELVSKIISQPAEVDWGQRVKHRISFARFHIVGQEDLDRGHYFFMGCFCVAAEIVRTIHRMADETMLRTSAGIDSRIYRHRNAARCCGLTKPTALFPHAFSACNCIDSPFARRYTHGEIQHDPLYRIVVPKICRLHLTPNRLTVPIRQSQLPGIDEQSTRKRHVVRHGKILIGGAFRCGDRQWYRCRTFVFAVGSNARFAGDGKVEVPVGAFIYPGYKAEFESDAFSGANVIGRDVHPPASPAPRELVSVDRVGVWNANQRFAVFQKAYGAVKRRNAAAHP